MVLLTSLSSYAQYGFTSMVGDGFGGRAGYDPVNLALGTSFGGELCGANKQLYLWGGPGLRTGGAGQHHAARPRAGSHSYNSYHCCAYGSSSRNY